MLIKLAWRSLVNRRTTALLTWFALSISIALVLGVDHLRNQARESFNKTLAGCDLIVGARTGSINLLLYSVFRVGNATTSVSWGSYQELTKHSAVAWVIPISLGDSHRGFPVLGTNGQYFAHYKYGAQQNLQFAQGEAFGSGYEAVLGANVAKKLGYKLTDRLVLAHGAADINLAKHDDMPFVVKGILQPTGTPVDDSIHVSLAAIEAIHLNWQSGPHGQISADAAWQQDLTPRSVTAMLIGLKSPASIFTLQRQINDYPDEALQAILPGVALSELWQMVGLVERVLVFIVTLILITALLGMVASLLAAMNERQREIAILRALGASAGYIFILVETEVVLIVSASLIAGTGLVTLGLVCFTPLIAEHFGLFIAINPLQSYTIFAAAAAMGLAVILGALPALSAYRRALGEGLIQRF
jgi:putative ABC transport system permease protein